MPLWNVYLAFTWVRIQQNNNDNNNNKSNNNNDNSFIKLLDSSQNPIRGKHWKRKKYINTGDVNRYKQRRRENTSTT
jgi:hypothetical protein